MLQNYIRSYLEKTHGANVTLIIDGFDEVDGELHTESFLNKLLQGKMLPKARVVVTSRPSASAALQKVLKRKIKIEGLDQTSRKKYVDEALQGFPTQLKRLLKCFQRYPQLDNICHIPLILVIIAHLSFWKSENLLPTIYEIYQQIVVQTIFYYLV